MFHVNALQNAGNVKMAQRVDKLDRILVKPVLFMGFDQHGRKQLFVVLFYFIFYSRQGFSV